MDIHAILARELKLAPTQVQAAVTLFDDGNTVPFVARYRKEVTGSLDEEQLRQLVERLAYLRTLADRKTTVLDSLRAQEKLTPELKAAIESAETLQAVEDLYQPFKPKRRTRAMMARSRGLEPLAQMILAQPLTHDSLAKLAQPFLNEEVAEIETAWAGARDIVAEIISDDPELRGAARTLARERSEICSTQLEAAQDPTKVFAQYYEFTIPLSRVRPYQILALNRGETSGALKIELRMPEVEIFARLKQKYPLNPQSPLAKQLLLATQDANERLLLPAIERDVRRMLTEEASAHAVRIFAENVRALLLQPPIRNHSVIGIDPGFRTGCKIAVIDPTGKVMLTGTIYPHEPQKQWDESKTTLKRLVKKTNADVFAIGNGTASRETEQLVAEIIAEGTRAEYLITSEQGASVYSASPLARAELPDLDVTLRGAVSIARRVIDPLAELVKIDPRSIGVGLYQHDLDDKQLSEALDAVVESVVNAVGVDVNTASPALLRYVAGIGAKLAEALVAYREANGEFRNRVAFRQVKGLGPKAFEQAAGFLRIVDGNESLDNTAIHPESYPIVRNLFALIGVTGTGRDLSKQLAEFCQKTTLAEMAQVLDCGEPTLADILEQLARPGRDPRDELPKPLLRRDVMKLEDLKEGMRLKGTVRNVVDFGAFVDIGLKHDGLLHKSQMRRGQTSITVGDVLEVVILSIDAERERIGLGLPET
ncbi:MAG: RNA-binding transcriptional accessory protein [Chloroflexi bacterium]|nr:RNA-binding transcriptional accessory protein [Chloroflexota bacterium]